MFRIAEIQGLVRFAFGLPGFLRDRLTYEEAERLVREGVARREERFLAKLEHAVFGHSRSPYLTLLRWAGCEPGDVRKLVGEAGIEGALETLRRAGVYIHWDELKGRRPVVRRSASFPFTWHDFDNPLIKPHYQSSSGGSSGPPVRVSVDLEHDAQEAPNWAVLFKAYGLEESPLIFWTPTHPGVVARFLRCSKFGRDFERWFALARVTSPADQVRSAAVHSIARLHAGYRKPEDAPLSEASKVLEYLLQRLVDGTRPVVNTSPSAAALVSRLAQDRGVSLEGVHFLLGAEPVTPARWKAIVASGARAVATYGTSETGYIGAQFPGWSEPDEVHVFRDGYAVIPNPSGADGSGSHPLLVTNLRSASPKVLINAELGDSAVIETGGGNTHAEAYGYDVRLHTIRSFRKVTVWGATFAVAELEGIMEEYLPARFGGGVADYQLVEQEDENGTPLLKLLVNPELGDLDEVAMGEAFLDELSRRRSGFMTREIRMMGTFRIERSQPEITARGKIFSVVPKRAG